MIRIYSVTVILAVFIGCSSEKATKSVSSLPNSAASSFQLVSRDTLTSQELQSALCDTLAADSNYDEMTGGLLERARDHYQNALDAEEAGDSVHSANEFEYAIAILNELGYYPNIENNRDFNDLSHSIIEDYEKYIANIDSLGVQSSIFALRKKLNEIDESTDNPDQDQPRQVITTTSIPLVVNGHVEQNIRFFQGRGRGHFERWLHLSGKYFPMMKRTFKAEGSPEELVYLSMVESGLNPVARSWAKAVGLWQFVKGTGQMYGLTGNFWSDDRRDFEKATHAAARHLKDLYGEFGDWYLALAAYNSGAGRVYRAIRRSGSTDFWKMRPHLPRETRNYVPQFIAVAVMSMDPKGYGFEVTPADSLSYDLVTIKECLDLSILAKCAKTDVETLRELNPALLRWCTPPGNEGYAFRIPAGSRSTFEGNYANIPDDEKRDYIVHTVHKRESIGSIAKKYGISKTLLAEANRLSKQRIKVGQSLIIPIPASPSSLGMNAVAVEEPVRKKLRHGSRRALASFDAPKGKEKLTYRIRKGDALGKIATWYDVRVSDLRLWNEIPYGSVIRAGKILTVWVPKDQVERYSAINSWSNADHEKAIVSNDTDDEKPIKSGRTSSYWLKYHVKAGDNLSKIAQKYSVAPEDVRKWNALRSNVVLKGQELEILIEDTSSVSIKTMLTAVKDSSKIKKSLSYTVKKGDTLHSIASTFGVSINKLRSINKIRGTRIHIGQELVISS